MRRGLVLITISVMLMIAGTFLLFPGESYAPAQDLLLATATVQTLAQIASTSTTAPALPTVPSPTLPAAGDSYTVQEGDTLFAIAGRYGVSIDALLSLNGLNEADVIYVGQTLQLPAPSATSTAPVAPVFMPSSTATSPTPQAAVTLPAITSTPLPSALPTLPPTAAPRHTLPPSPAGAVSSLLTSTPALPMPQAINGVPLSSFIIISEAARQNIQYIFAQGQTLGRNPRAFSKIGDSTIEPPHFLSRFDEAPGTYQLGDFVYLTDVIAHYQGAFGHSSVAVRRGMHAWSAFDPAWSNRAVCLNGEGPLPCEIRTFNPSVIFIRLGSNDVGVPEMFERSVRRMVAYCLEQGVIPIIGTKADRHEGSNINNEILRRVAVDFAVPLWDFDVLAGTIPGRGLDADNVHMTTFFAHDYSSPVAFTRGHGVHNLSALMMLDAVWRITQSG